MNYSMLPQPISLDPCHLSSLFHTMLVQALLLQNFRFPWRTPVLTPAIRHSLPSQSRHHGDRGVFTSADKYQDTLTFAQDTIQSSLNLSSGFFRHWAMPLIPAHATILCLILSGCFTAMKHHSIVMVTHNASSTSSMGVQPPNCFPSLS